VVLVSTWHLSRPNQNTSSGHGITVSSLHTAHMQTDSCAAKEPSTFSWLFNVFSLFLSPQIKLSCGGGGKVSVLCLVNQVSDAAWSLFCSMIKAELDILFLTSTLGFLCDVCASPCSGPPPFRALTWVMISSLQEQSSYLRTRNKHAI